MKVEKPGWGKIFFRVPYNIIDQIINPKKAVLSIPRYLSYITDIIRYYRLPNSEKFYWKNISPKIHDKFSDAGVSGTGFYQNVWAFRLIFESGPAKHIDIGSNSLLIGILSNITHVTFIDIRPLNVNLDNLEFKQGDILNLPFDNETISSMSCLHTIEHIGLGRYGDKLDPKGSENAIKELRRVLAPGGNIYISVPVGRPRVNFNCRRIFSPHYIVERFHDLTLREISGVGPDGLFYRHIDPDVLANMEYSIGLFWFEKNNAAKN